MKKLSLSICVVMAVLGGASFANAQGPGGPGGPRMGGPGGGRRNFHPGDMERKMLKDLHLSPGQQKKTDALIAHMVKDIEKLGFKPGMRPSPEMRDKFRAVRGDFDKHLQKILTAAQYKKYDDARKAMRARMRGGAMPPGTKFDKHPPGS